MPWDVTPQQLAAHVISSLGSDDAAQVRDIFAVDNLGARCKLTATLYWSRPEERWPALDAVMHVDP